MLLYFTADEWVNVGEFSVNERGQLDLEFYEGMEKTLWAGMSMVISEFKNSLVQNEASVKYFLWKKVLFAWKLKKSFLYQ